MGNAARIISNTFYLFLDWIVLTLGGYFFWVIIGKLLSPGEVGHFSTVYNISIFLVGFASLGINVAITKLFPYYQKNNEARKIAGSFWWAAKVTLLSSIAFGLALVVLHPLISTAVPITSGDAALIFFTVLITNLVYVMNGYLYGLQKIKSVFIYDTVLSASKVIITFPLLILGYGYLGPVYGFLAAMLLTLIMRYRLAPKGRGPVDRKRIWFYSIPVFVSNIGAVLVNQGNIIILSILSTASSVGLFSLMFFLSSPARMIPQLISYGTFPVTAQQSDDKNSVNRIFFHGTRYSMVLALPIIIVIAIFSEQIVLLLASPQYLSAANILVPLTAAYIFIGLATIFTGTLYATGKVNESRDANLIAGFVNLLFSFALIPGFGLLGASLAFMACGISMCAYSLWKIKTSLNLMFPLRDTAKIALSLAVFYLFSYHADKLTGGGYWLFAIIAGVAVYSLALLATKFFNETDIRMIGHVKSKFPKFTHPIFDRMLGVILHFSA